MQNRVTVQAQLFSEDVSWKLAEVQKPVRHAPSKPCPPQFLCIPSTQIVCACTIHSTDDPNTARTLKECQNRDSWGERKKQTDRQTEVLKRESGQERKTT